MATESAPLRQLLLDPGYWMPRLGRLASTPRQLVLFPRPDLARPGTEVLEMRMRAFDGERLHAFLARPCFSVVGERVQLRAALDSAIDRIDWAAVERGGSDLVFTCPGERRLEDRVLDVLRIEQAAGEIESIDCECLQFGGSPGGTVADELRIAALIRSKGWLGAAPLE
jgi:hypothetical protein